VSDHTHAGQIGSSRSIRFIREAQINGDCIRAQVVEPRYLQPSILEQKPDKCGVAFLFAPDRLSLEIS
jgi:exosome complex RNA-binding protein Csl4